ncbi:MAG: hypothetical protein DLD55_02270 [candidate division SR1 bacterium]|nr:MAG: hypothetical protein DLD55_02270 [candidate division SR1 bacterium]
MRGFFLNILYIPIEFLYFLGYFPINNQVIYYFLMFSPIFLHYKYTCYYFFFIKKPEYELRFFFCKEIILQYRYKALSQFF